MIFANEKSIRVSVFQRHDVLNLRAIIIEGGGYTILIKNLIMNRNCEFVKKLVVHTLSLNNIWIALLL